MQNIHVQGWQYRRSDAGWTTINGANMEVQHPDTNKQAEVYEHLNSLLTFQPKFYLRLLLNHTKNNLQSILEQLVHARHLARNAQINSPVSNLHNETTSDFRVDLWNDLELLSLTDVLALEDSRLERAEHLVVQRRSRGDGELDLALVR